MKRSLDQLLILTILVCAALSEQMAKKPSAANDYNETLLLLNLISLAKCYGEPRKFG